MLKMIKQLRITLILTILVLFSISFANASIVFENSNTELLNDANSINQMNGLMKFHHTSTGQLDYNFTIDDLNLTNLNYNDKTIGISFNKKEFTSVKAFEEQNVTLNADISSNPMWGTYLGQLKVHTSGQYFNYFENVQDISLFIPEKHDFDIDLVTSTTLNEIAELLEFNISNKGNTNPTSNLLLIKSLTNGSSNEFGTVEVNDIFNIELNKDEVQTLPVIMNSFFNQKGYKIEFELVSKDQLNNETFKDLFQTLLNRDQEILTIASILSSDLNNENYATIIEKFENFAQKEIKSKGNLFNELKKEEELNETIINEFNTSLLEFETDIDSYINTNPEITSTLDKIKLSIDKIKIENTNLNSIYDTVLISSSQNNLKNLNFQSYEIDLQPTESQPNDDNSNVIDSTNNFLQIKEVVFYINDARERVKTNGAKARDEIVPGDILEVEIEICNLYSAISDIEIKDIEIDADISRLDSDFDNNGNQEVDVEAGKCEDDIKLDFDTKQVPYDAEEETYTLEIKLNGRDELGFDHTLNYEVKIDLEKERDSFTISSLKASSRELNLCENKHVTLTANVYNTGTDEEQELEIRAYNTNLGFSESKNFLLDVERNDLFSFGTQINTIGAHDFIVEVTDLDTDELYDSEIVTINAIDCNFENQMDFESDETSSSDNTLELIQKIDLPDYSNILSEIEKLENKEQNNVKAKSVNKKAFFIAAIPIALVIIFLVIVFKKIRKDE